MADLPRISIITPSFNQGEFLGETLQSLVDQDYPNLETIIQDGQSTDGSIEIAQSFVERHPDIFQLHVERDSGQADALNRGFARSTGQILGFLNSDDRLRPGCLRKVAKAIDSSKDRQVVFGRSLFFGDDPKSGQEHPCAYDSRYEQLAIWKRERNRIPQPSTFWTREVWDRCGPIDATQTHALDYDLFCRISQLYDFHKIDAVLSDYRLHKASKTVNKSHQELMADCLAISRRYWGPWSAPLRWKCELSSRLHQRSKRSQAKEALHRAEVELLYGTRRKALNRCLVALWQSPVGFRRRILLPIAAKRGWIGLCHWLASSLVFQLCPNRWIGPYFETKIERPSTAPFLRASFEVPDREDSLPMTMRLCIGNRVASKVEISHPGPFELEAKLMEQDGADPIISLIADRYFIPAHSGENEDRRMLTACNLEIELL